MSAEPKSQDASSTADECLYETYVFDQRRSPALESQVRDYTFNLRDVEIASLRKRIRKAERRILELGGEV